METSPVSESAAGSARRPMPLLDHEALFEALPGLFLILDTELRIVAVTNAYAAATMTRREEILGRGIFDVFPDNPGDPGADGTRNLRASLNRVLETAAPDTMPIQRYDIKRPDSAGGAFEERYWSPQNVPVLNADGSIRLIIHRVDDTTEFVRLTQRGQLDTEAHDALRKRAALMESDIYNHGREVARVHARLKEAQQSLRQAAAIITSSGDAIVSQALDGRITSWNPAAQHIFGYGQAEMLGQPMALLVPPDRHEEEADFLARIVSGQSVGPVRTVRRINSGQLLDVAVTVSPVRDEQGRVVGASSIARDLTERLRMERAAQVNEQRLMNLFDRLSSGVAIFRAEPTEDHWVCIGFNPAAERIEGVSRADVTGRTVVDIFGAATGELLKQVMLEVQIDGQPRQLPVVMRNGEHIMGWRDHDICRLGNGELAVIYEDTTNERQAAEKVYHQAHHDALTGLPNRRLFGDRLQQAFASAQRQQTPLGLMFVDLDHFKEINDTRGHHIGDLLLQEVARRMKACLRESDTLARLGGDEFVVVLPALEAPHSARLVANKLCAELRQPFVLESRELQLSCSIGVALYPHHAHTRDELISQADQAMYLAKNGGRDCVCVLGDA